jgi:hypothetical protein
MYRHSVLPLQQPAALDSQWGDYSSAPTYVEDDPAKGVEPGERA